MRPHQQQLTNRLQSIINQLTMAKEDAAEDFHGALGHAEIAQHLLATLIVEARNAISDGEEAA